MRTAILERFAWPDTGTFGWMTTPSGRRYATVERPWFNNAVGISCIPLGEYVCKPSRYNRGGYDAIEVTNVDGRTHIKIHIANEPSEVAGCIGTGVRHGALNGNWAVLSSESAFNSLMSEMAGETFKLKITNSACGKGGS